jgi:hypothetical protein
MDYGLVNVLNEFHANHTCILDTRCEAFPTSAASARSYSRAALLVLLLLPPGKGIEASESNHLAGTALCLIFEE